MTQQKASKVIGCAKDDTECERETTSWIGREKRNRLNAVLKQSGTLINIFMRRSIVESPLF